MFFFSLPSPYFSEWAHKNRTVMKWGKKRRRRRMFRDWNKPACRLTVFAHKRWQRNFIRAWFLMTSTWKLSSSVQIGWFMKINTKQKGCDEVGMKTFSYFPKTVFFHITFNFHNFLLCSALGCFNDRFAIGNGHLKRLNEQLVFYVYWTAFFKSSNALLRIKIL